MSKTVKSYQKIHFRFRNHTAIQRISLIVVVIIVGCIGTYFISTSRAASFFTSSEVEKGTLSGAATIVTDSTASGGSAVKFGTGSTTGSGGGGGSTTGYTLPPTKKANGSPDQWYWEISPNSPGVAGLPSITDTTYPAPGSANIWDTDLFQDSNVANAGVPTGPSPVVTALHAAGDYSICYVETGAYQIGFPDGSNFAPADYGATGTSSNPVFSNQYQMQGYANEYWFNLSGFANYVAGNASTLTGVAPNIAAALDQRFKGCKTEGQDAVEPDDLDGYTNASQTGAAGGGWGLTQADSTGFERWLAYDIHSNGLAAFEKNDTANEPADEPIFDGMIIEECNYYNDPCSGSGGDATAYLSAGKPVLNAEYTQDGETTAKFCSSDEAAGITGALFDVSLSGTTYEPCEN